MAALEVLLSGQNVPRLLHGLWLTLYISVISVAASALLGTGLGLLMRSGSAAVRAGCRLYLETIRIVPILVWLFVLYFGLPTWTGWHVDALWVCVGVFSLWGTAEMGDLVRAAITSIPRHQYASAQALGLTPWQTQRHVVLPQAARRLLPTTINLTNRMIMTTPLVALIGVVEVLKVGQQIIDSNRFNYPDGALWIYGTVLIMYFVVCFPISWAARRLERKWATT